MTKNPPLFVLEKLKNIGVHFVSHTVLHLGEVQPTKFQLLTFIEFFFYLARVSIFGSFVNLKRRIVLKLDSIEIFAGCS